MSKLFVNFVLCLFLNYGINNVVTGNKEEECKKLSANGYRYDQIYSLVGESFDHVTFRKNSNGVSYFEMRIAIKSTKDGIILLSPIANPGPNDFVYEIGVGISGNQYTVVRIAKDSSNEVVRIRTPNILSDAEYKRFYIKISDGLLMFGREDDRTPIFAYRDDRVSTVKYFGISSWGSNSAIFHFDCPTNFKGCKRYIARGYNYHHMYPIDGHPFDHVVVTQNAFGVSYFEMRLAIKTEKDGIILLSPLSNPGANDFVYEIGVGIAGNQYTVVRVTKDSSNEVVRIRTPHVLSASEYTWFYLKISDGVLILGKEGERSPIISYQDSSVRNVKYFGMSSWGSNSATFLYDCPAQ